MLMVMLSNRALSQSSCTRALMSMSPCLNYVTGNSSTPSSSCRSQLSRLVQSQPQCHCSLLKNGGGASLGVSINQTLALALPGACNVQTPPTSQCNTDADVPTASAPAPASSPVESLSDSSNEIPEIPTMASDSRYSIRNRVQNSSNNWKHI